MDVSFLLIMVLTVGLVIILAIPLLNKNAHISDQLYSILKSYQKVAGSGPNQQWKFVVRRMSPLMNRWGVGRLDRLLRLAGRPGGRSAEEMFIFYTGSVILGVLLASQIQHAKAQAMILALGIPIIGIQRLIKKKDRRQLEAEEATRFLKQQLVLVLRQNVPIMEALQMMAKDHPGEFGETFRHYLNQVEEDGKPLRQAMKDFREEYEAQSLDDLCLSIELSDVKSPDMLADQIYNQTLNENARVDEFIEKKKESSKGTMTLIVGLSFAWTLAICVYFAYYGFVDHFRGGGGFLNF